MENYYKHDDDLTLYPFVVYPTIFEKKIRSTLLDEHKEFIDLYDIDSELISGILYHNLDFINLDFKMFFYSLLFKDISKNNNLVQLNIKYLFTFDNSNCTEICKKTKTSYGTIELYKSTVLYIIHIDYKKYKILLNKLIGKL